MIVTDSHEVRAPDVSRPLGASTRAVLGSMDAKLERLFLHDQQHVALLKKLNDQFIVLEMRTQDYDKKLEQLEAEKRKHASWRTKLSGIYVGVALTITTVGSLIALVKTFTK
jgi:ABC-type transporter Mla subunit MlaD